MTKKLKVLFYDGCSCTGFRNRVECNQRTMVGAARTRGIKLEFIAFDSLSRGGENILDLLMNEGGFPSDAVIISDFGVKTKEVLSAAQEALEHHNLPYGIVIILYDKRSPKIVPPRGAHCFSLKDHRGYLHGLDGFDVADALLKIAKGTYK